MKNTKSKTPRAKRVHSVRPKLKTCEEKIPSSSPALNFKGCAHRAVEPRSVEPARLRVGDRVSAVNVRGQPIGDGTIMAIFERLDNGTEVAAIDLNEESRIEFSGGVVLVDNSSLVIMTSLLTKLP